MLKRLKLATLRTLKAANGFAIATTSRWRRARLLILAYHGISIDDEHEWNPSLFMSPEAFRSRLQILQDYGCEILPLAEAVQRLYAGSLPQKAVAITFDDGLYDFYKHAFPILSQFNYRATVYLTTFYTQHNFPVFDVVCPYLLWKGRANPVNLAELMGKDQTVELSSAEARTSVMNQIHQFVREHKISAEEKDQLARKLARQLNIDYETLCAKRILHLLKPDEVRELSQSGIDIQLHTHRHRTPHERTLFQREILDNRQSIEAMIGRVANQFCYPSGVYHADFLPWLKELNVDSATTCDPGLASRDSNRLLLPRFVDTQLCSSLEFEAWLTGIANFLPQRQRQNHTDG